MTEQTQGQGQGQGATNIAMSTALPASTPPQQEESRTFTVAQLNTLFAERANQAERSLLRELFGDDKKEDAAQFLKDARALLEERQQQRSEQQTELERERATRQQLDDENKKLKAQLDRLDAMKQLRATTERLKFQFANEQAAEDAMAHFDLAALKSEKEWDEAVNALQVSRPYFFQALTQTPPPTEGKAGSQSKSREELRAEAIQKARSDPRYAPS